MIEEIIDTVSKYASEKVKLSKGALMIIAAGAFLMGIITGSLAAGAACRRKNKQRCYTAADDFDADEYVRNLNFDDE